jgi:hypothetical protein
VPREAWTGPQELAAARNTAITLLGMAGFRNIRAVTKETACFPPAGDRVVPLQEN